MSDSLPPRAQAILDLVRDAHDPTGPERGRVRERVAMTLAATVAGSAAASTAQAAAGALGTAAGAGAAGGAAVGGGALGGALVAGGGKALFSVGLTKVVGTVSLVAAVAGGTVAVVAERTRAPAPAPAGRAAPVEVVPPRALETKPAPSEAVAAAEEEAVAPRLEVESVSAPVAPRPRAPSRPQRAQQTEAPTAGELGRELSLIRGASQALQLGDATSALEKLAEHARSFPSGSLAAEREGLRVMARCQRGDAGAVDAARRLLQASPGTVLGARIRKACGVE